MTDDTRTKGLGDLRTVTTNHITSKPPRKGTTYLDLFTLSMERQRLEQELTGIEHRRKRIIGRLTEAQNAMEKLVEATRQEKAARSSSERLVASPQHEGAQWKKIPVEY